MKRHSTASFTTVFARIKRPLFFVRSFIFVYIVIFVASMLVGLGCSKSSDISVELTMIPEAVGRGDSVVVTLISDQILDDGSPEVSIAPGDGLRLLNVEKIKPRVVTFQLMVDDPAPTGKRMVSLELGNTVGESELRITEAAPIEDTDSTTAEDTPQDTASDTGVPENLDTASPQPKVALRPDALFAGQTKELSLFGTNTHFSAATVVTFPEGSGLVVEQSAYRGMTLTDGELLSMTVRADETATIGNIIGTVESPVNDGFETAYFVIEVLPAPSMTASPSSGYPGDAMSVVLRGDRTHFQGDAPATLVLVEPASAGVSINLDRIASETEMTATLYLSESAAPGAYEISAATTLASGETETVVAAFTVLDNSDTDTSGQSDSDSAESYCSDFLVAPNQVSIGSFNIPIRFEAEATANINWRSADVRISLVGENTHLYLGELTQSPEEKCYVSTNHDISCTLNAGLAAAPGEYEIHITSGGVTHCGRLTVTGDDIGVIEIPSAYLPTYNLYTGTLDAQTNVSDFYSFSAAAGTTAVFHAYSLNRTTMDPVLRLIDVAGDSWITYEDDETSLGIDARMVFHFAEGGDFHLEVGPKLSDNEGDYQLYTYLLTHGNISFETEAGNDTFESAQTVSNPMGAVVHATLDTIDDVDYYSFETTGPTTVQVVARRLDLLDDGFADTRLTLYDDAQTELDANSAWYEIPSTADPRLFISQAGSYTVKVTSEEVTSGFYALNIRPYLVINELDNTVNNSVPFVELQGYYNLDLTGYELCTFNGDGNPVDPLTPCADLTGFATDADGYVAIYADDFSATTMLLPEGDGAVSLLFQGSVMDKVQYGVIGGNGLAEGTPADVGTYRAIGRGAGVDSNNNKKDFIYMASPTPGMPNDRTYQSAIPLYGEPAD